MTDEIFAGPASMSRYIGRMSRSVHNRTYVEADPALRAEKEKAYRAATTPPILIGTDIAHALDKLKPIVRPLDRPDRIYVEGAEVPATKRFATKMSVETLSRLAELSGLGKSTVYDMLHMRLYVNIRAARALCQAAEACKIELKVEDLMIPQKSLNPIVGW